MTSQRLGWQTCDQPSSAGPSGFHQCHWTRQISENRTSIYSSVTWQYIVWVCSAPKWTHRPSSWRSTLATCQWPWWSVSVFMVSWCLSSLSQRPLHTRYCHLRSSASAICSDWHSLVPRARTATGQQNFVVNASASRNRLPPALRSPDLSESVFKQALKTHVFSTAQRHWDVFMILAPDINIQTSLLTNEPHLNETLSPEPIEKSIVS